jgi:hypothetical protein
MRVILNRIFLGVALLVTLVAHYWLEMAWKPSVVAGGLIALVYYIAWELRVRRVRGIAPAEG